MKRRLRAEVRKLLHLIKGLLMRLTLLAVFVCVVPGLIGTPAYEIGLIQGFFITAILGVVLTAFMLNGDGAFLIAGSPGESSTLDELEKGIKVGHVWSAVHNIEVGRDVDPIVLSPAGVLALKSKWRFRGGGQLLADVGDPGGRRLCQQGQVRAAEQGRRSRDGRAPDAGRLGGARRELPKVQTFMGVDAARGEALVEWLESGSRGRLSKDDAAGLLRSTADLGCLVPRPHAPDGGLSPHEQGRKEPCKEAAEVLEVVELPPVTGRHRNRVLARRRGTAALHLVSQGMTYQQVAGQMGYRSRGTVHRIVQKALPASKVTSGIRSRRTAHERLEGLLVARLDQGRTGRPGRDTGRPTHR